MCKSSTKLYVMDVSWGCSIYFNMRKLLFFSSESAAPRLRLRPSSYHGAIEEDGPDGMSFHSSFSSWWFFATPLKNHGVRQLGLWHFHGKSFKIPWFQSPASSFCLGIKHPVWVDNSYAKFKRGTSRNQLLEGFNWGCCWTIPNKSE